ncbi:TetR/AcrR family transcriptional regulator [Ruegeria pomeroyi]|uniref:TetR/AcrR family transcriptional regulator n=1 Tax=Ruegeria alba TaxID=2916756 RepID=A0ABS9NUQ4_9RHOB|nr:TetR/AcrR family transcriptional regulator [Ruegeria alba]MCE8511960.1 TetR/AcrR family transcriptional regulator [Ruegeria pomeroyi]MCE8520528.1 TetR/AcrR family transcriptional regulator [Ruegeria pomeroyi]MCE8524921.1 TetR/AcrR family transcriptional regulator [Ruegeria pomeroyi]MCE8528542.1 TetR/AcrR family transcriptional regulator [Ruegeria pomeroyi]MCE8533038.1 TetR/AcrR family transcriptional regulator [Ruegeria pomeroyi]
MPETLKPTPQDRRSRSTQAKVIRATIACLDRLGYAETTFARIQERAGVSRGAITHHFPTRQALVAATAMELLARALDPVERRAAQAASPEPVRDLITRAWGQVVNAAGGRAMVEILVACRTDAELYRLLETRLHDWDRQSRASVARAYIGADPAPDDAELLWSMTRNFLRGLVLHERFVTDPAYLARMVERFAGMMESQLTPLPAKDAP